MTLSPLYKRTKTGAIQVCNISFMDDTFTVEFGQLNGKMQSKTTTCTPKNIGKSNESSGSEQAKTEAIAKHISKVKSGYSIEQNPSETVKLPMKVKTYQGQEHNIDWSRPVYVSPKLNGVNGEFKLIEDQLKLFSRGGNEYPMLDHLEPEIREYLNRVDETSVNVELYKHGWHLQDITAAVKKFKSDTHDFPTSQIEAHIFDIPANTHDYEHRHKIIRLKTEKLSHIFDIEIALVHNTDDIERSHEYYTNRGYEGTILRNAKGLYIYNQRSSDVFKYKKAQDAEFKIIGHKVDKNGHPVLNCNTNSDTPNDFWVKPKGTADQRRLILLEIDQYPGRWYKVEFECYSKDMVPLKPVGIGIRECDENGDPLE